MTHIAIVGGGPAGLMAAERLSASGVQVDLYDQMPSLGRRFLMAGRGGLNLTHSEPFEAFVRRYGRAAPWLEPVLRGYTANDVIRWAEGLGQPTFIGSSGRVFPKAMKASPLLRAWLARLSAQGVRIHQRHVWTGWTSDGDLQFDAPGGPVSLKPDAVIIATGGASWPRLGDGRASVQQLAQRGVTLAPFQSANAGINIAWTEAFIETFAGQPLKGVALTCTGVTSRGDAMVTRYGLEGGAVYSLFKVIRDQVAARGSTSLSLDLRPQVKIEALTKRLASAAPGQSTTNRLRKAAHMDPLSINLMREGFGASLPTSAEALAGLIKAAPLKVTGVQGLERAISSAGGVALSELDDRLMLRSAPGVFCAGEMLDWEAPTGGYLLQASFATGWAAAGGVTDWLAAR